MGKYVSSQPFVSIVTPVHNGATYLAECIESVFSQTYANWEFVIVNNCSTDDSEAVAVAYAQKDSRVKLRHTGRLLKAATSWNYAVSQISTQSEYCKVVHADDWLFPECLSRMVELAACNPSIVMVSSYRLLGGKLDNDLVPYPNSVIPGREAARWFLLDKRNVFGSPSSTLLRCDAIRRRGVFYRESNEIQQGVDVQACLEILKDGDLGFVHQLLTFSRMHPQSLTTSLAALMPDEPERLHLIKQFGPYYLQPEEYEAVWKEAVTEYARMLGSCLLFGKDRAFWAYHREQQRQLDCPISSFRLARGALWKVVESLTRPIRSFLYWRKWHHAFDHPDPEGVDGTSDLRSKNGNQSGARH
jgi:glycosyltransferase involved in cell wall biosynthesis